MPYCTPDNVRNAFKTVLTSGLTPPEVDFLCQHWSDYVDGWLAARYTTPITPTPAFLRSIVTQLVWLDIMDRSPQAPDFIVRRFERIEKLLQQIATGEVLLPGVEERIDIGTIASSTRDYIPVFGGVPSLSERFDPNRRRDEISERAAATSDVFNDPFGGDVDDEFS